MKSCNGCVRVRARKALGREEIHVGEIQMLASAHILLSHLQYASISQDTWSLPGDVGSEKYHKRTLGEQS